MKKILLLSSVLASLSALNVHAGTGTYFTAAIGSAEQEVSESGIKISGDDTSIGFHVGSFVASNFALEFGAQGFGEADDQFLDGVGDTIYVSLDSRAFTFGGKYHLPLSATSSAFVTGGLARWSVDGEIRDSSMPGQVYKTSDDGFDYYVGVGGTFNLAPNIDLSAQYTMLTMDAKDELDTEVDVSALMLGLSMYF